MRRNLGNLRKHARLIAMVLLLLPLFTLYNTVSSFKFGSSLSSKQQRIYELQPKAQQLHRNGKALFLAEKSAAPGTLKSLLQQPSELSTRNDIIIIAGFEAFNIQLYKKAAAKITWVFWPLTLIHIRGYAFHMMQYLRRRLSFIEDWNKYYFHESKLKVLGY